MLPLDLKNPTSICIFNHLHLYERFQFKFISVTLRSIKQNCILSALERFSMRVFWAFSWQIDIYKNKLLFKIRIFHMFSKNLFKFYVCIIILQKAKLLSNCYLKHSVVNYICFPNQQLMVEPNLSNIFWAIHILLKLNMASKGCVFHLFSRSN